MALRSLMRLRAVGHAIPADSIDSRHDLKRLLDPQRRRAPVHNLISSGMLAPGLPMNSIDVEDHRHGCAVGRHSRLRCPPVTHGSICRP